MGQEAAAEPPHLPTPHYGERGSRLHAGYSLGQAYHQELPLTVADPKAADEQMGGTGPVGAPPSLEP